MTTPRWGHKPLAVADIETYWSRPAPEPSARMAYWVRRYRMGEWEPNRALRREGYYGRASMLGVWLWEANGPTTVLMHLASGLVPDDILVDFSVSFGVPAVYWTLLEERSRWGVRIRISRGGTTASACWSTSWRATVTDLAPLDDPDYDPLHKPVRGRVPEVVKRWGKASQLRWWRRFRQELWEQIEALPLHERLKLPTGDDVDYWCESPHHKGGCCYSCFEEGEGGYDDHCCCKDERSRR